MKFLHRLESCWALVALLWSVHGQSVTSECPDDPSARYVSCHGRLAPAHVRGQYAAFLASPSEHALDRICSTFQSWLLCLRSVASDCQDSVELILDTTPAVRRRVSDICIASRDDVTNNIECLLTQRKQQNVLFQSCFTLMQLRIKAQIYNRCSVVLDYIHCEDQLVRSACGSVVADFRLSLTLETKLLKYSESESCFYQPMGAVNIGYTYSLNCPPEFPLVVKNCYSVFAGHHIVMHHSLLGVVKSASEDYHGYCSAFEQYRQCVESVSSICPQGLQHLYQVVPEWRHKVMVAEHLCDNYDEYLLSWPCYQTTVTMEFPRWCQEVYDETPTGISAYASQCGQDTDRVQRREQLVECYTNFIDHNCGSNASELIEPLLRLQYGFGHLAPCFTNVDADEACDVISASQTVYLNNNIILSIVTIVVYLFNL